MQLTVLAVADCPNAPVLEERLAAVLHGREDVSVSRELITDECEAERWGMHGSPTLLVDGADPFAEPGQSPSMSCRLYRSNDGRTSGAPSTAQLRQVIGRSLPRESSRSNCNFEVIHYLSLLKHHRLAYP